MCPPTAMGESEREYIQTLPLQPPPLEELRDAVQAGLDLCYEEVQVEVRGCWRVALLSGDAWRRSGYFRTSSDASSVVFAGV